MIDSVGRFLLSYLMELTYSPFNLLEDWNLGLNVKDASIVDMDIIWFGIKENVNGIVHLVVDTLPSFIIITKWKNRRKNDR